MAVLVLCAGFFTSLVPVVGVLLLLYVAYRIARAVMLATMVAYVACFAVFVLYPVAGPNYAFDHPTGPVREVWSARLVYNVLAGGSSFGAAFPSSHVAATLAATVALWRTWKPLGALFTVQIPGGISAGLERDLLLLVGLFVLAVAGPGRFSLRFGRRPLPS